MYAYVYKHMSSVNTAVDRRLMKQEQDLRKCYTFDTYDTVNEFWFDLQYYSLNTPTGESTTRSTRLQVRVLLAQHAYR